MMLLQSTVCAAVSASVIRLRKRAARLASMLAGRVWRPGSFRTTTVASCIVCYPGW